MMARYRAWGLATLIGLSVTHAYAASWSTETHTLLVADFDGDSRDDVLYIARDAAGTSGIAISDGTAPNGSLQSWPSNHLGIPWYDDLYVPVVGDFNGDGRADLFLQAASNADSFLILADQHGRLLAISQTIGINYRTQDWPADQHRMVAGDFNGDGNTDLFLQAVRPGLTNAVFLANANTGQFDSDPVQTAWSDGYLGFQWSLTRSVVHAGDFNADGKDDLLVQAKPEIVIIDYEVPFPVPTYRPGSFGIVPARAFSGGTIFRDPLLQIWDRKHLDADWSAASSAVVIADFNDDGSDDIFLQAKRSELPASLMLANGSGQFLSSNALLDPDVDAWSQNQYTLHAANFDGVGAAGLYLQPKSTSGSLYVAATITGATVTTPPHVVNQPSPATAIGRTPGVFSVSAAGEAEYSIALWNPPGINSLQPSLALRYSSRGPNGLLGVGWGIEGLSTISRCPKTWEQDGTPGPVALASSDTFCLDGNRLRSNGGSEYRTELETFSRITANGTAGAGPAWFKVERRDGLIFEYGYTADSRIEAGGGAVNTVRTWALNEIRDRAGNAIRFSYDEDTTYSTYRISEITYPYPASGGGPYYRATFVYEARPAADRSDFFVAGYQARETNRLDRIDVSWHSGGIWQLVKRYELFYELAAPTKRSRLSAVQECSPSACLSPTWITYQDGTIGFADDVNTGHTLAPAVAHSTMTIDMNGDGREDLLYHDSSTNTYWVMLATGSGFAAAQNTLASSVNHEKALPFDFNSDGRTDLLIPNTSNQWLVLTAPASGVTFSVTNTTHAATGAGGNVWTADYDGDGRPDLIWAETQTLKGRLNTGTGFSSTVTTLYTLPGAHERFSAIGETVAGPIGYIFRGDVRVADINGDKRADLIVRYADDLNEGFSPANWIFNWRALASVGNAYELAREIGVAYLGTEAALTTDLNADGLTDVLANDGTHWRAYLGTGTGLSAIMGSAPVGTHPDATLAFDWDGDGRGDLIIRDGAEYRWYRWNGGGFDASLSTGMTEPNSFTTTIGTPRVADIDGDGLNDWVYFDPSTGAIHFRRHAGAAADLLRSVTDGFGISASFLYLPLTNGAVYEAGGATSFPQRDVRDGTHVVREVLVTDGTGNASTRSLTFTYKGARAHLQGRGFLGFEKRKTVDGTLGYNQSTEETYRQDFPFTGLVDKVEIKQSSSTLIRELDNNWLTLSFSSGSTLRNFPYASSSELKEYEVGGASNGVHVRTVSRAVTAIDSTWGTITDQTTTTTEVATGLHAASYKSERTYHSSVLNDATEWCIGRPELTQRIQSHTLGSGAQLTRTIGRAWDSAKCRLSEETIEPGNATWEVTTALFYDSTGNVERQEVTGVGMTTRTTSIDWGARRQLPESITRAVTTSLSETETQGFRYDLGLQTSSTDPNGLVTSLVHDDFGRPTLETRPDGTSTTWAITKCQGCEARVKYAVEEKHRRSGDSLVVRTDLRRVDRHDRVVSALLQQADGRRSAVSMTFDARGRLATQTRPRWDNGASTAYTSFLYDSLDRVTKEELYTASNVLDRSIEHTFNGLSSTTTDALTNATTNVVSAWGDLIRVTDAGTGITAYEHDAFGLPKKVTDNAGNVVASIGYNVRGMRTSANDADMGAWTYTPNALGALAHQENANGQDVYFEYDLLGRITERTENEGVSTWTWGKPADNTSTNKYAGRLKDVSGPGYSENFVYDELGRLKTRTISSDATYQFDYGYNSEGTLDFLTYPTSTSAYRFKLAYEYTAGYLSRVKRFDAPSTVYWQLNSVDPLGNISQETYGNTLQIVTTFDALTGLIDTRKSGVGGGTGIQNLDYDWDKNGNLTRRKDLRQNLDELFEYDALNRLDRSTLNGIENLDVTYNAIGNITAKSDVGSYTYGHATKKHAVTAAGSHSYGYDANGNQTSRDGNTVSWYSHDLPNTMNGSSGYSSQFFYAPDRSRWKQVANYGGTAETTIYVGGSLEKVTRGGVVSWKHFIDTPAGRIATYTRRDNSTEDTFYFTKDHLGSIDSVTNAAGTTEVRLSYDAFGKRRNELTWSGAPTSTDVTRITDTTRRGHTFHEMLDNLELVHMNGRVHDPVIGRFISPDPLVQDPTHSQSFNRYSYVWNNPLSFTDPTGFETGGIVIDIGPGAGIMFSGPGRYRGPIVPYPQEQSDEVMYAAARNATSSTSSSALSTNGGSLGTVILTFDDGPLPGAALNDILNVLAARRITAEFYVIGSEVHSSPEAARRIVSAGQIIQNHSWSHLRNLVTAPEAIVRSELGDTQRIIASATGATPTRFRPPYGNGGWPSNPDPEIWKVANQLGLGVRNWEVDTEDWRTPAGIGSSKYGAILRDLMRHKGSSEISVLMHVQPATARDLPAFIDQLNNWGFTIGSPK